MKKTLVVGFKILLPLLFLYNIGFFSLNFSSVFKDVGKGQPFNQKNNTELIQYINGKIRAAESKGRSYGPYDYFRDLHEIKKFEMSRPGTMGYQNMINPLMQLHSNNISRKYFSADEISKAREYYDELENPGITQRNKIETEHFKKTWWPNLSDWLLKNYLKNLPLAFFLFLFWWYQEKKHLKVLNPLSFIVSLIFYPITIALVIKEALTEEGRYYFAEAELRRTKDKMFTILSADEVADLRRFAKNRGLTLADWKKYLGSQGLSPQRLLVPALTLTLLFMFVPRASFSQELAPSTSAKIFAEKILLASIEAPPNIVSVDNHFNSANPSAHFFHCDVQLFADQFPELNFTRLNAVVIRIWDETVKAQEYLRKIEHIPCLSF